MWQPIETAPEDTSPLNPVDLWLEVSGVPADTSWGVSRRIPDCWYEDDAWVYDIPHIGTAKVASTYDEVTHWMPLPAPPVEASATTNEPTG